MRASCRCAAVLVLALVLGQLLLTPPTCAQAYAVPSEDATPEVAGVSVDVPTAHGILASLKALWNGNRDVSSRSVPDAASKARAAAGADGAAFEAPLQRSDSYGERLQRLHRSSSDAARAAWSDAGEWAQQPWPRTADGYAWARLVPSRIAAWHRENEVDFLRKPWYSGAVVAGGVWAKSREGAYELWDTFKPGGRLTPESLFESQGHIAVEAVLLLLLFVMFVQRAYKPGHKFAEDLTEKEVDELCTEWEPEPLAPVLPEERRRLDTPVITGDMGTHVDADGKRLLNLASANFLGLAGDESIRDICRRTIEKYGVGACGPRGFYGTIDVHLDLEAALAAFMRTEEAILYSYDMATVPSILPAFANKRDLIICDEAVNFPIQNGAILSRSKVLYFKHNDMADLEAVLQKVAAADKRSTKPLNRRYIVVEGIYVNAGDLAPLQAICALKYKYKYRLVVDESISLGVLGKTGRGAAEHAGLQPRDVDIIAASLGNSLASIGGFCAGDREIVDHQRLSGAGYCFSAALPPYLATAATGALARMHREGAQLAAAATANARRMRHLLADVPGLQLVGGPEDASSPQLHLRLESPAATHSQGEALLSEVAEHAQQHGGTLLAVHRLALNDRCAKQGAAPLPPSLRVAVSAAHTESDLEQGATAIRRAAAAILKKGGKF
mmetsp:Transcript_15665/g.47228  ORF Transcript_15665/g.47228 Transcript_15665/m.47228 type:complete len:672 (-) Transcript_15665:679-2694(-)|eukprot:CAMPEP_0206137134 /NCGR_PEP_ID=MMETSP1473-20131121/2300_1 /ASSEMBLY_ACC=CAM_ASM_001109 /TAXON_ID=1461547 /ORGANISM="Stichococcus sp, Strain RCC1054" /LENGTH=671 /DNA_ID=CAMNT_0053530065 /DNA_START=174 /DNA_END=2189 /DNA_ORIENTATION=+